MKRIYFLSLLLLLLLGFVSCNRNTQNETKSAQSRIAKGGRVYGGVFKLSEAEYIKTLYPPNITDAFSYRVASQVYEGLFKFDPVTLRVVPALVESYTVDSSKTIYTFKLKSNLYFHDDPCFPDGKGRGVTAEDVKFCFTQLCTQSSTNQNFALFQDILKGANQYFKASANRKIPSFELEGVKVIDPKTIQLKLEKPSSILLYNLARPGTFIYPPEALAKYGTEMRIKTVGTGPFRLTDVEENISMVLKKHDRYHGSDSLGNALPFLDAVSIQFIKDKKTELFEFRKGNLDMLYRLPTDYIIEILEDMNKNTTGGVYSQYELQREPEMMTQFLAFNTQNELFKDVNIRKAFSFAIDRESILENTLNGEGFAPGFHGITPPAFQNYDINKIKGYTLNLDSAQYYLAKAGFPNGKGFPNLTLILNAEGSRNTNVAVAIQKQLKDNLNIDIELSVQPIAQVIENGINGSFGFLRLAWVADYPSAENFLWIFHGRYVPASPQEKSFPNIFRYNNPAFNNFYERALRANNLAEADTYFTQAEQVLMNDAPIIVLWYDEGYRLIQSYVKNFPNNPMQYRDLSQVWLDTSQNKIRQ